LSLWRLLGVLRLLWLLQPQIYFLMAHSQRSWVKGFDGESCFSQTDQPSRCKKP